MTLTYVERFIFRQHFNPVVYDPSHLLLSSLISFYQEFYKHYLKVEHLNSNGDCFLVPQWLRISFATFFTLVKEAMINSLSNWSVLPEL